MTTLTTDFASDAAITDDTVCEECLLQYAEMLDLYNNQECEFDC